MDLMWEEAQGATLSSSFGFQNRSSLTRVSLAEHLDGGGHFLLTDAFILLPLGGSLESLPGQRAQVKVHEHVAQGLQIIPSGLLCGRENRVELLRF